MSSSGTCSLPRAESTVHSHLLSFDERLESVVGEQRFGPLAGDVMHIRLGESHADLEAGGAQYS